MIIQSKYIPIKGFIAMAFWPFVFMRKDALINLKEKYPKSYNMRISIITTHEHIHFKQQKELLIIGFYLLYLLNWLYELIKMLFGGDKKAYKDILFEREAKQNQKDFFYLDNRKPYAWLKY